MSNAESLKDIIIAIICSGAFFSLVQFLIQRWDTKRGIEKKIDGVSERLEEHRAVLARTHILRFADELRNGTIHSEEYFRQQLQDITTYTQYCDAHPQFKNKLTVMSSKYIEDEFKKRYFHSEEDE